MPPEKIEKLAWIHKWIQDNCEYNDKVFLVNSAYVDASVKDIPPDPNLPDTVEHMDKLTEGHDGARADYDAFVAQDEVRKVLGSRSTLSLVDEQWVGVLRLMINGLTKTRKIIDFHNARIAFEKILKYYVRYRAELEKEVQTLLILEGLKSADATSQLWVRLGEIASLVHCTASSVNDLAKWSIMEKPKVVGPTWYQLGSTTRNPFHLFVSLDEAKKFQTSLKKF